MRPVMYCLLALLLANLFGCASANQPILPSATAASSITPTIILTVSPLPSPTPIPTLVAQSAENAIKQMLNQETECAEPCLFGIIPDRTTLEETQSFYEHLNMNFKRTYKEGKKHYYEAGFGFDDNWGIIVTNIVEDGIVRNLALGLNFVNYTGSTPQQEWLAFRPNAILERYGQPSDVEITLSFPVESGFSPGTAWYDMVMHFPETNLIVSFRYKLTNANQKITACPLTDASLGMSMWLGKEPHNPPKGIVSLGKATILSLDEFYDLLTKNSQTACFELNENAFFPKP